MERTTVDGIAASAAESIARAAEPFSQEGMARLISSAYWPDIDKLRQAMKTLQDRAEAAEIKVAETDEQNVQLVTRNTQLETTFREIREKVDDAIPVAQAAQA